MRTLASPTLLKAVRFGDIGELEKARSEDPGRLLEITPKGNTLLHIAVISNNKAAAEWIILEHPHLLLTGNSKGDTPLHLAVRSFQGDMVECLITVGERKSSSAPNAMLKIANLSGDTPLHIAFRKHYLIRIESSPLPLPLVKRLLGFCLSDIRSPVVGEEPVFPQVNRRGESLLFLACGNSYFHGVVEMLLQNDHQDHVKDEGPNGSTALHAAVKWDNIATVNRLLERRPGLIEKVDSEGRSPFFVAAEEGRLGALRRLLEFNANAAYVPGVRQLPVHAAAEMGRVDIIEELLLHFVDSTYEVNELRQNILHIAVMNERVDLVRYILSGIRGSCRLLDEQDLEGNTPLHLAAATSNYKTIDILCSKGADRRVENSDHLSPLGVFYKTTDPNTTREWRRAELSLGDFQTHLKLQRDLGVERKIKEVGSQRNREKAQSLQNYINGTVLVATLMCTVTFAAAFTVPGGFRSNPPDEGSPVLSRQISFVVFLISNTISMCCSVYIAILGIYATVLGYRPVEGLLWRYYTVSIRIFMWSGFLGMIAAFASGMYATLAPDNLGPAVFVCALCAITSLLTFALPRWGRIWLERHEIRRFVLE